MTEASEHAVDPQRIREVMGHYPTGVTVVTAVDEQGPIGLVVGTFTSVSLDPPLVAFLPTRSSGSFARLKAVGRYCINVVAYDQLDLCRRMAVPSEDKFEGVEWSPSPLGAPMLADAVAHVHCTSEQTIDAGDHFIELCRLHDLEVTRPVTPLLFFQGGYGGFSPHGMSALGDSDLIAAVKLAEVAQPQLEKLARELTCEASALVPVGDAELITAACAFGGDSTMREALGQRLPLMPPLGEAFIAYASPEAAQAWVAKAQGDEQARESLRQRLVAVRERGYSLSLVVDGEDDGELSAALAEYASGDLTPARLRAVRQVIAGATERYELGELDPAQTYGIRSISVPVRDPQGEVVLVLRVTQLPSGSTGERVLGWIGALKNAAHGVERALSGTSVPELDDYLSWVHEGY